MTDILTIVATLITGSVVALVSVFLTMIFERRRAKAERLLDFKRNAYMELSRTLRATVDHMATLGHLQSMDLSAEERISVNIAQLQAWMYALGSEEFALDLEMEIGEMPDDPSPEEKIEFLETLRTRLFLMGGFELVRGMKEALEKQEALEFIDLPTDVRQRIDEVRILIQARIQDQTLDGVKKTSELGELISIRPMMEWAKEVSQALERMKAAMKSDIEKIL